ncbi:aminotransferase class V-fold PLP-dependent enzyme [Paenibacillus sp. MMS20-IR301]|uniref:aminotransferase class V-fold PLP-dependent enzyme n=1 Tax=Paenibacillus sp. MMS20-IR301 TaxID=2895946 RepID=UPI0028E3F608|nr:aminotransferase class V-fold PLP-dependent enzyme [Paenibacillus sp. MMS20-IR301]WNS42529.1 aminotransferase class V-fold PLP-dependent enzyme [Paenibacillus sp. MMS20-IR301]
MLSIQRPAAAEAPSSLQEHFASFREHTIGERHLISTPYGKIPLLYADWTASGRLYEPIERRIQESFGPYVSNPHTDSNTTGLTITLAYNEARRIIRQHVNAASGDALLFCGNGTTGAVNKLLRIMGLRLPGWLQQDQLWPPGERPVVFVTHMEHHSNLLPWQEAVCDVVTVPSGADGQVELPHLEELLRRYRNRRFKIGSFTACSNVTGLKTPYHQLAAAMHRHGGLCFVDFAASAPYEPINMHPESPQEKLDAIFFSPHKFLGGPGTGGVLLFDTALSTGSLPDEPGGGTVVWVNRWGGRRYIADIEVREDGGTPGFLQAIRTALCIRLKEEMNGPGQYMAVREQELCRKLLAGLAQIPGCSVLAGTHTERHGIVSFTLQEIHYNLAVRLLNDRFGIQARGGCSCAGPYGHELLGLGPQESRDFIQAIHAGDQSLKPGWVRLSLHPIMTDSEVEYLVSAVQTLVSRIGEWRKDYRYSPASNSWMYTGNAGEAGETGASIGRLFTL